MQSQNKHKELETILVLVLAAGVFYWATKKPVVLLTGLILGLTGLLVPTAAKWIHWTWMKLATGLGFVMNRVLLTLVFIIILTPLGWITRMTGKSSVRLKKQDASYFKDRNHAYTKEDLENMW